MIKINLIFDRKAIEREKTKQQLLLGVLLIFITIGISGFLWYSQNKNIEDINKNISDSKEKLEKLKSIINKINDKEKKKKRLEEIVKVIVELKNTQKGPARILDNINTILSSEIWLISLSEGNGQMKIDGFSFSNPSIAMFMENIKASRYFSEAELLEIQQTIIEGEKVKKFTLNITLNLSPEEKVLRNKPINGKSASSVGAAGGGELSGVEAREGKTGLNVVTEEMAERLKGEVEQKKVKVEEKVQKMKEGR